MIGEPEPIIPTMGYLLLLLRDPIYTGSTAALLLAGALAVAMSSRVGGPESTAPADPVPIASAVTATAVPSATATAVPSVTATTVRPATATSVPTPAYDAVLRDARRQLDLAAIRDALELFDGQNGVYPSTSGDFATVCAQAFDAGCQLLSVTDNLPATDGETPYWYQSDGLSYTLFARAETDPDEDRCPAERPPALGEGPLFCVSGGNR